jgi:hypothetical protein
MLSFLAYKTEQCPALEIEAMFNSLNEQLEHAKTGCQNNAKTVLSQRLYYE